jgi:hypothetical protein
MVTNQGGRTASCAVFSDISRALLDVDSAHVGANAKPAVRVLRTSITSEAQYMHLHAKADWPLIGTNWSLHWRLQPFLRA